MGYSRRVTPRHSRDASPAFSPWLGDEEMACGGVEGREEHAPGHPSPQHRASADSRGFAGFKSRYCMLYPDALVWSKGPDTKVIYDNLIPRETHLEVSLASPVNP